MIQYNGYMYYYSNNTITSLAKQSDIKPYQLSFKINTGYKASVTNDESSSSNTTNHNTLLSIDYNKYIDNNVMFIQVVPTLCKLSAKRINTSSATDTISGSIVVQNMNINGNNPITMSYGSGRLDFSNITQTQTISLTSEYEADILLFKMRNNDSYFYTLFPSIASNDGNISMIWQARTEKASKAYITMEVTYSLYQWIILT